MRAMKSEVRFQKSVVNEKTHILGHQLEIFDGRHGHAAIEVQNVRPNLRVHN
jgi:hypothetical protein